MNSEYNLNEENSKKSSTIDNLKDAQNKVNNARNNVDRFKQFTKPKMSQAQSIKGLAKNPLNAMGSKGKLPGSSPKLPVPEVENKSGVGATGDSGSTAGNVAKQAANELVAKAISAGGSSILVWVIAIAVVIVLAFVILVASLAIFDSLSMRYAVSEEDLIEKYAEEDLEELNKLLSEEDFCKNTSDEFCKNYKEIMAIIKNIEETNNIKLSKGLLFSTIFHT